MPNSLIKLGKKTLTAAVTVTTIFWSVGVAGLPLVAKAAVPQAPALIKAELASVYYLHTDGKRYVFPNETTYFTWYTDFAGVTTITNAELANIAIGGNVTQREGGYMVKITTDPKTYWVGKGGTLHHVQSEANAVKLAGADWAKQVRDVPDAFFINYKIGAPLDSATLLADGMLYRAAAGGDVFVVDGGKGRKVSSSALSANRFQDKFVRVRSDLASLSAGAELTDGSYLAATNPGGSGSTGSQPGTTPTSPSALTVTQVPVAARTVISDGAGNVAPAEIFEAMRLKFTGNGKVTKLVFKRTGVSADSDIDRAVIYKAGMSGFDAKLAENTSFSSGVMTFSSSAGLFTVTNSLEVSVMVHQNRDTTAGKSIGLDLTEVATDGSVTASVPMPGALYTVAVVTDLANLLVAGVATAATVDSKTADFDAMRLNLTASNQDIEVSSMSFKFIGSARRTGITNLRLVMAGQQVATIAALDDTGVVTFNLATPYRLRSGVVTQVTLRQTVGDEATRNVQWSVETDSIVARDMNYNIRVRGQTSGANAFTFATITSTQAVVNTGNATLSLSSISPSSTVPLNATAQRIGLWQAEAVGEAIKINGITGGVDTDDADDTGATNIRNVKLLIGEKGKTLTQFGTTQTIMADCSVNGDNVCEVGTVTVSLTYVFETGKIYEIAMEADMMSAAGAAQALAATDVIQGHIFTGTTNAERVTSGGIFNLPNATVTANRLTITAITLGASVDTSLGAVRVVQNTTKKELGRFTMSATADALEVFSWTIVDRNAAGNANAAQSLGAPFTNLELYVLSGAEVGGTAVTTATKIGVTVVTNSTDAAGTTYTFTAVVPVKIKSGGTASFAVVGDARSNADANWTDAQLSRLSAASSTSVNTGSTVNLLAAANLQAITVATGATVNLTLDGSSPASRQILLGSTDNVVGVWRLTETSGNEEVIFSQFIVTQTVGAQNGNVKNVKLWYFADDGTWKQAGQTISSLDGNSQAKFAGLAITVKSSSDRLLRVSVDSASFADLNADGGNTTFRISFPAAMTGADTETATARGASGNFSTVNGAAVINVDAANNTYYRALLTVTLTPRSSIASRSAAETLGTFSATGRGGTVNMRSALLAPTDSVANVTGTGLVVALGAGTVGNFVDGANAVRATEDGASAVNDLWNFDLSATAAVQTYTRIRFFIRSSAAKAANDLSFAFGDTADATDNAALDPTNPTAETNIPALAANTWTLVDLALPGGLNAAKRFLIFTVNANPDNGATIDVDHIVIYNDYVELTVTGNLCAAAGCQRLNANTPEGATVSLRDTAGNVLAFGYYDGSTSAGTVRLFSGSANTAATATTTVALSFGSVATVLNLVVDTSTLVTVDTTASETLNIQILAGSATTAGGLVHFNQTTRVTFTNPPDITATWQL